MAIRVKCSSSPAFAEAKPAFFFGGIAGAVEEAADKKPQRKRSH